MTENIFSLQELKWLQAHSKTEEQINESLEDSLNVNSLDSGEPDLIPHQRAVKAAHITIEIAEKKLIAGPYDNIHWQIICKHLSGYPSLINKGKKFWNLFSFHCACFKEQEENWPRERIYMEAMKEMINSIEEGSFELIEGGNEVANLDTNAIQQIKGKGVNAKFAD